MNHYTKFLTSFAVFCEERKRGNTLSSGQTGENFEENIKYGLRDCKIFEIDDNTKKLLLLTNPPDENEDVMLPFDNVFLDVGFTKEELNQLGLDMGYLEVSGILFNKGQLVSKEDKVVAGTALRITIFSRKDQETVWFDTFNTNVKITHNFQRYGVKHNQSTDKKARKLTHHFTLNFLNLLHNPEIKLVEVIRSKKNQERREREGKIILPSSNKILLTGEIKEYVNRLNAGGYFHYSCSFWIRGHWRTLRDENRWGTKTGTKMWIFPYIKGKGLLINKKYKLKKGDVNENS